MCIAIMSYSACRCDVYVLTLQEVEAPEEVSVLEQHIIDVCKLNISFRQRPNFAVFNIVLA